MGAQDLLKATWRASRSPWLWTPAAVGGAGVATAAVALGRLLTTPPQTLRPKPPMTLRVDSDGPDAVRLSGAGAAVSGRWGLEYPGGAGEVGPSDPDGLTRAFRLLSGRRPADLSPARLHAHIWPDDRATFSSDTGIAGSDVSVHGETGLLPCWVFPAGDGRRWAILVHGRGAPRAQMLRLVPTLHSLGITTMVVAYRNDFPHCSDPSGRMHFGHREWVDLEDAVGTAMAHGAAELILCGMSMGGGIVKTFLQRSDLREQVIATVLEAPALDWGPILRHCARARRVPSWLVPPVMTVAGWQARIDWRALNHIDSAPELTQPMLLIHGEQDPVVPVELSDAYAAAAPETISYLRVPGAGHVSAWNTDSTAYEAALSSFLAVVGAPSELAA